MKLYLTMPQPGETITEGTLVEWLVKPGDVVKEADPVAQLETDKAVFEYESPFEGKIETLLHQDGERVPVSEPIAIMEVAEDKARLYQMMGIGKAVDGSAAPTPKQTTQPASKTVLKDAPQDSVTYSSDYKISPYCRKLARSENIANDVLINLASQNSNNRVTKSALESYLQNPSSNQASNTQDSDDVQIIKCSAIRMRTADNMVKSKTKIPHAHNGISIDMTRVVEFREANKDLFKTHNGCALNFLSLIYTPLVRAIQKVPVINASYDDSKNPHQIKIFKNINLGVAAGTDKGLVIPVVHAAQDKDFNTFNAELCDKLSKAKNQKLAPQDLQGATLVFNNFGFFGTNLGIQVIPYPMAAILGMGNLEKRVVVTKDDKMEVRTMADFVLTFDHRAMDGRETGQFLKELKDQIESVDLEHVDLGAPAKAL